MPYNKAIREYLMRSWAVTRQHLEAARTLLPVFVAECSNDDLDSLAWFDEFLEHNELGLALDQLKELGELSRATAEFWQHLDAAEENMSRTQKALEVRLREP